MPEAETPQLELNRPMFAEAERRLALKKDENFFFVDKNSDVLQAHVKTPGLTPY